MIRRLSVLALAALATPALAASPFDGTWKADIASAKLSDRPDVFALVGGTYSCKSCTPPVTVPADGRYHPVTGHDYYDSLAVKVVSPRAVLVMARKEGKPVFTNELMVAPDGKTLTITSKRTNTVTGTSASGSSTATRVAAAPKGGHAISGSWRATGIKSASDETTTQTLEVEGETLTLSTLTGEGYAATFGGPAVAQTNDAGGTMVAVKRLAPNHIVETDTRGGKVVQTYDMTVHPDGRTMTMVIADKRTGGSDTITLKKQ